MEDNALITLLAMGALIGILHTVTGPDHYVPFVAMARVRRWSLSRTLVVTSACGVGHVLSSVVIGVIGISAGLAVGGLELFEGMRGRLAGWLLLGFGVAYFIWGIRRAIRNRPHTHLHGHPGGIVHSHAHGHSGDHAHVHTGERPADLTPWVLFTIFVFGPCEPLIPILMFPAAQLSFGGVALVALVFGICTLATMCAVVTVGYLGLSKLSAGWLTRFSHAIAGFVIAACGAAVQFGL